MKKIYYLPIALILVLLCTNPSLKNFEEYLGISTSPVLYYPARLHNYFIFSSYTIRAQGSDGYYFAIAGNFFYIKSEKQKSTEYLQTIYDHLNTKLELGTFDDFKERLKDKRFRLSVYAEAVLIIHLDDYGEFEERINLVNN